MSEQSAYEKVCWTIQSGGRVSLNQYQELAGSTNKGTIMAVYRGPRVHDDGEPEFEVIPGIYNALGLAGEAGEFLEKLKKRCRDNTWDRELAAKELGDVLWYLSQEAKDIGYSLEEIAVLNLKKLADRKARGVLGGSGDSR